MLTRFKCTKKFVKKVTSFFYINMVVLVCSFKLFLSFKIVTVLCECLTWCCLFAANCQYNIIIFFSEIIPQVSDLHKDKVLWISVIIVVHVLGVLCIILVGKFFIWVKHGVPVCLSV